MLAIGVAGVSGAIIGARFRAPALLAASVVAVAAGAAIGIAEDRGLAWTVLFAAACLLAAQVGYLLALFLAPGSRRRS
jgi:hypothetical protein